MPTRNIPHNLGEIVIGGPTVEPLSRGGRPYWYSALPGEAKKNRSKIKKSRKQSVLQKRKRKNSR